MPDDPLELSMDTAAGLHNLESFTMAELKEGQEPGVTEAGVTEETVVYFSPSIAQCVGKLSGLSGIL